MVDCVLVLLVLSCALYGYLRGVVFSLLAVLSVAVAVVVSIPFGPVVGRALAVYPGWSPAVAQVVGRLVAGIAVWIPIIIVAYMVDSSLGRDEAGGVRIWNRALGVTLGLAFGLALAGTGVCALDVAVKVFPDSTRRLMTSSRNSWIRQSVSPANPADRFLITDVLRLIRLAREHPDALRRLTEDERVGALLENPQFQALMDDEGLLLALEDLDVATVLANEHVRRVLADRELRVLMAAPETRSAVEGALAAAGQERHEE